MNLKRRKSLKNSARLERPSMGIDDYELPDTIPEPPQEKPERAAKAPKEMDGIPASLHMEVTVLGAMMLEREATQQAFSRLVAEDFSLDSHKRVFRAIQAVTNGYDIGEEEEIQSLVRQELMRRRELESIGGISYLLYLTEGVPRHFNIESYVKIIKDKSLLRKLMGLFHDAETRTSDQSEDGIDIATDVITKITEAIETNQTKTEVFDSPTMAMDAVERLLNNPKQETAIATGFRPLDEFTNGGIRLGELWIIGASPSRGKTTLARQIVKHVVRNGIPCYVHSGEMTKESWYDVTACLMVGLPAWKVRNPLLMNLSEQEALRSGLHELSGLPFHISDAGGINIDKLIWNASRAVRQHNIQMLVIDYAQIINATGKDERQKVTTVAQKLRVFAKDNNVATILLSQSPRPEGRSINSRPNMFSLKESGSLEEAAHCVILPFRKVDPETNSFTGEDELVIGLFALVDDEDFERISRHKWYAQKFKNRDLVYASRNVITPKGKHIIVRMHREILGLSPGDGIQADHRDRSKTLDNRKSNLRRSGYDQNGWNVEVKSNSTTGLKGVSPMPPSGSSAGKFRARIRVGGGKRIFLGIFDTPDEAKQAYDQAALKLHGEFARL
ncbi:unnamed protein product [Sphagnum jensenii]